MVGVSAQIGMALGLSTVSTAARPNMVSAVIWEWERDDGGFSPYSPEVSAKIELTKEMGSAFVSIGKRSVDLSRSVQIRRSTGSQNELPLISLNECFAFLSVRYAEASAAHHV